LLDIIRSVLSLLSQLRAVTMSTKDP